jgi:hypothetical protein
MEDMCNEAAEKAAEQATEKNTGELIRSIMDSLNLTVEQALAAAKIPDDKKELYRKAISEA